MQNVSASGPWNSRQPSCPTQLLTPKEAVVYTMSSLKMVIMHQARSWSRYQDEPQQNAGIGSQLACTPRASLKKIGADLQVGLDCREELWK